MSPFRHKKRRCKVSSGACERDKSDWRTSARSRVRPVHTVPNRMSCLESLYSKDYFYYSYWPFHKFGCWKQPGFKWPTYKTWAFNSINKATEVATAHACGLRHSTRLSVWPWPACGARRRSHLASERLWRSFQLRRLILSGIIPSVNHFSTKFLPLNTAEIHVLCMVYIMMSKTEEKFVNFMTHKCFCWKIMRLRSPPDLYDLNENGLHNITSFGVFVQCLWKVDKKETGYLSFFSLERFWCARYHNLSNVFTLCS